MDSKKLYSIIIILIIILSFLSYKYNDTNKELKGKVNKIQELLEPFKESLVQIKDADSAKKAIINIGEEKLKKILDTEAAKPLKDLMDTLPLKISSLERINSGACASIPFSVKDIYFSIKNCPLLSISSWFTGPENSSVECKIL